MPSSTQVHYYKWVYSCTVQLFTLHRTELTYKCTAVLLIQAQCVHHKCVKQVSSCSANWTNQNVCTKNNKVGNSAFHAYLVGTLLLPYFLVSPCAPVLPWGYLTFILRSNNTERDIKAVNKCAGFPSIHLTPSLVNFNVLRHWVPKKV